MNCECIAAYLTTVTAIVGFAITIYSLWKSNKEKCIANVIALKVELRQYDDLYFKLLPKNEYCISEKSFFAEDENKCKELGRLYSYLGLFEIAYRMIVTGSLTKTEFEIFFFYRLKNISGNVTVMEIIKDQEGSWSNFLNLMKMFKLKVND